MHTQQISCVHARDISCVHAHQTSFVCAHSRPLLCIPRTSLVCTQGGGHRSSKEKAYLCKVAPPEFWIKFETEMIDRHLFCNDRYLPYDSKVWDSPQGLLAIYLKTHCFCRTSRKSHYFILLWSILISRCNMTPAIDPKQNQR